MAVNPYTVMSPTGWSSGRNNKYRPPKARNLTCEEKRAHVLIVGNGLMSHWASVWIFEDARILCVELTADGQDGKYNHRWGIPHFNMYFVDGKETEDSMKEQDLQCPRLEKQIDSIVKKIIDKERKSGPEEWLFQCKSCQENLINFMWNKDHKYEIMTMFSERIICECSEQDLLESAKTVLEQFQGQYYDLFYNNCQRFLVDLLCDHYKDEVEIEQLPWTIGSVVSGPLMLVLEVAFSFAFSFLEKHEMLTFAIILATCWTLALLFVACRYAKRSDSAGFKLLKLCGVASVLVLFAEGKTKPRFTAINLTFLWDLAVVYYALEATKALKDRNLLSFNIAWILASCIVIGLCQESIGLGFQIIPLLSLVLFVLLCLLVLVRLQPLLLCLKIVSSALDTLWGTALLLLFLTLMIVSPLPLHKLV